MNLLIKIKQQLNYYKKRRFLKKEAKKSYYAELHMLAIMYHNAAENGTLIDFYIDKEKYIKDYITEHWNDSENTSKNICVEKNVNDNNTL